jgi:hypothetical protein
MSKSKEELIKENQELKNLVKEGKQIFAFLNETLGLESAAKSNFFMAKISGIIMKVQRNPEIFNDVLAYSQKINAINIDEDENS